MAIKAADQITIVDITDAYSVMLTSDTFGFMGNTSGAPAGLTCSTQAVAYCGTNQCASVTVTAADIVCPTGISATVAGSGTIAPTITFTTTATVTTACEATIPVEVDGIVVNKKFSFTVAKQGATGSTGAAGKGVKSTSVTYQKGTSGTTAPTGTWQSSLTNVGTIGAGEYLWTRTVFTYTDNTTSTAYSVGMMGETGPTGATGATGKGVKSTAVTYQKSTNGTTAPTGTWQTTIAAAGTIGAGEYLWTRTIITYTDNTSSTAYSVGMKGATGPTGATGAAGADALTVSVTTSNGTVFKNSSGSTVLTAHVYKGGIEQTITDAGVCGSLGSIKWYKGTSLVATAKTLTVSASQVVSTAGYTCQLEG